MTQLITALPNRSLLNGVLAGLLATVPMTIGMLFMNKVLPTRKPDPLPPEQITENLTEKVQVADQMDGSQQKGLALAAHFAYGSAVGTVLGPLTQAAPMPPAGTGITYGLLIWSASYLGLMPALRLYPPATKEPARMNALMILAHVIWGASAGVVAHRLSRQQPV